MLLLHDVAECDHFYHPTDEQKQACFVKGCTAAVASNVKNKSCLYQEFVCWIVSTLQFTFAPWLTKHLTASGQLANTAWCRGVNPLKFRNSRSTTFAPLKSSSIHSIFDLWQARWAGVCPLRSGKFTFAPAVVSFPTIRACPVMTARCNGVCLRLLYISKVRHDMRLIRYSTSWVFPCAIAMWRGL